MNINELATARDQANQRVVDLQNKQSEMGIKLASDPSAYSDEEIEKFSNELKNAKRAQKFAQSALDDARKGEKPIPIVSDKDPRAPKIDVKKKAQEIKDAFVKDFTNMVTSGGLPAGSQTTGPNAGLTIPDDVQTAIHTLIRQYDSLEQYVNVENVSTPSGSRVYEKLSDIKPLDDLDDETAQIGDNDDPELTVIKYAIHRYAGITTVTNTLLADTTENILAWLETWIARKVVVTRNQKIIEALGKAPKKPTISKFDDIKDLENNTLDPAINATSIFLTNQSGFNALDKLKDANGDYLIQPNVTNPKIQQIGGHVVAVVADRWLPDVSGSHPLYFGDLKQGITLYDRQNMSLVTTNIGGGAFEHDNTKLRVIDRFDVQLIDDGAFAAGSFKTVADQTKGTADTDGQSTGK